jgi:dihydroxyacetone kinase-like protein
LSSTSKALASLIDHVCDSVIGHADELTGLDRAIGDADHGLNMQRGFLAVKAKRDALGELEYGGALSEVGKTLVMTVGGASGPLYGTLFMRLGQELSRHPSPSRAEVVDALHVAIEAVKARGKAQSGQKTMLDVLEPLYAHLVSDPGASPRSIRAVVLDAAEATIPMKAERGRASFLGERSRGHMDPGARSSALIVCAVCDRLEAAADAGLHFDEGQR